MDGRGMEGRRRRSVGAESDRKMRISFDRCVLVLDKVFRDWNVPFVQFPGSFCS